MQSKRKSSSSESATAKRRKGLDFNNFDFNNLDFNNTYSIEEFELIKNYLKVHPNFELVDRKLISIPYTPIAAEAIKHEISRQLGNWNLKNKRKGTTGIVTTPKGGFDFDVTDCQKIRTPDVAFTPGDTYTSLDENQLWSFQGQPFTPIFVVEVADLKIKGVEKEMDAKIKKDYFAKGTSVKLGWLIDPINCIIWIYKRDKNGKPYRRSHKWEDLDGGNILPGFTLELQMINNIVSQESDDEEEEESTKNKCPYCDSSIDKVYK